MKTKHLFFAAAMPLVFAACSNDELEVMAPNAGNSSDARPLVEVKLDFQKEGDGTRVNYNGTTYSWTSKDEFGALLMDEIVSQNRPFGASASAWNAESWVEHYGLVNYIHTAYPFTYDTQNKEWVAPSKLQEGNYFFVSPYNTYGGERQAIHRIDDQVQVGGTEKAMNDAIAANQYFIGYAQVKAGTENKEAIKKVTMTPALAPIKVTLRNIGTQAKNVKQIVVRGSQIYSALTIDPTDAAYGTYNLDNQKIGTWGVPVPASIDGEKKTPAFFNYANLTDNKGDVYDGIHFNANDAVYNIAPGDKAYSKAEALRALVAPVFETENAYERQAVLNFKDAVKINAVNGEINFAVMVNTIDKVKKTVLEDGEMVEGLVMDIITTEGQIANIDLTNPVEEISALGKPNTALVNIGLTSLKPNTEDELIIQFDNNSVDKAEEITVVDGKILEAFILWNQENTRMNTVNLKKDVVFTSSMYKALMASKPGNSLAIKSIDGAKLILANDVNTDVLAKFNNANTTATIVLDGTRELKKTVADDCTLTIENKGTLTIAEDLTVKAKLTNNGTMYINGTVTISAENTNNSSVTVNGVMNCTGNFTNNATIQNNGEIYNLKNASTGLVKVGADSATKTVKTHMNSDEGKIDISANFDSKITDKEVHHLVYTVAEGKSIDMWKLFHKENLKTLIIDGGSVNGSNRDDNLISQNSFGGKASQASASIIVTSKGGKLNGIKDSNGNYSQFSYINFEVNGDLAVENFKLGDVKVNAKTTTVSKNVWAKDIVLGSYNEETYVPVTGKLVVNDGATLEVDDIVKNAHVTKENAIVQNDGSIKSTKKDPAKIDQTILTWNGNNATNSDAAGKTKVEEKIAKYNTYNYSFEIVPVDELPSSKIHTLEVTKKNANLSPEEIKNPYIEYTVDLVFKAATLENLKKAVEDFKTSCGVTGDVTAVNYVKWSDNSVTNAVKGWKFNYAGVLTIASLVNLTDDVDADNNPVGNNGTIFAELAKNNHVIFDASKRNAEVKNAYKKYGLEFDKLTMKGSHNVGIAGDESASGETIITVNKFDYSGMTADAIYLYYGYVKISGTANLNDYAAGTIYTSSVVTKLNGSKGRFVITRNGDTSKFFEWSFGEGKWVEFK